MAFELRAFELWLMQTENKSGSAAGVYGSLVRVALRTFKGMPSKDALEAYVAALPTTRRAMFRSAWRAFTRYGEALGVEVPRVADGKRGPIPTRHVESFRAKPVDFAIAYLAKTIAIGRLSNVNLDGRGLRWTDVEFLSPADAVIRDDVRKCVYRVHRRPLDVLLRWGRPDGQPVGALVPNEPGGRGWMSTNDMTERVGTARELAKAGSFPDDESALIWAFPAPRVETGVDASP